MKGVAKGQEGGVYGLNRIGAARSNSSGASRFTLEILHRHNIERPSFLCPRISYLPIEGKYLLQGDDQKLVAKELRRLQECQSIPELCAMLFAAQEWKAGRI